MSSTTLIDKTKALVRGGAWRSTREEHIRENGYCVSCGREKELEVHHVVPWAEDERLRLDPHNLLTLCRPCHLRFGHLSNWKDSNKEIRDWSGLAEKVREARGWGVPHE
jgi:5-methylcytosine-specific restriction endonuclease McrA